MAKNNPLLSSLNKYLTDRTVKFSEDDIRANPMGYSLLAKLTRNPNHEAFDNEGNLTDTRPSLDFLLGISSQKAQDIDDNEAIMQLLPDLERAALLLISYIISPNNLKSAQMQYKLPDSIFPQTVSSQMVEVMQDYLEKDYRLSDRVYNILYDVLFTKGSHPIAVIPEASLDEIINPVEINKESFNPTLSLEEINKSLYSHYRPSRGYIQPRSVNPLTLNTESYNGLEVSHGSDVIVKSTKRAPEVSYTARVDTRLSIESNYTYEFPSELAREGVETVFDLEIKGTNSLIELTDDISLVTEHHNKQEILHKRNQERMGFSTESVDPNTTDRAIIENIFKSIDQVNRNKTRDGIAYIKTNEQTYRQSVSEPIIVSYPAEAVIPIYTPGNPSQHSGYLVLHDEEGAPLSKIKPVNYYRELSSRYNFQNNGQGMASSLIQQGRQMFEGYNDQIDEARQIEILSRIHGNAIIREITNRLRQGELGKELDIGDANEAFRIMFYRALKGQRTRILYMPKEVMTYIAIKHDTKGMGVSLIDNMKVLLSLKIQFMLARIRTGIMNSVPETVGTIKIDDKDPDPKKTIKIGSALMLQSRQYAGVMPGLSNVQSIEDTLNRANIRINIDSENPRVPNIGHDISRNTADIPTPDSETGDMLDRMVLSGFYLPPEMIDNSFGIDFSRQVYQQNFLVGLVSNQIQANLNPQFTQFGRKAINSSPNVRQNLTKIITANLKDILETVEAASGEKVEYQGLSEDSLRTIVAYLVNKAVETVEVILPEPLTEDDEAANERISKLETRIDKVLEYMISPDILPPDVVGDKANSLLDSYRNILKADIMRSYFVNDGYGQEVLGYFAVGDDGKQTFEANKQIRDNAIMVTKALAEFFKEGKHIADTTEAVLDTNEVEAGEGGGSSYSSSDTDSGSDDTGDEGGFGGEGDFDFGGDEAGWDVPGGEGDSMDGESDQS